jgi:hypothetical protein
VKSAGRRRGSGDARNNSNLRAELADAKAACDLHTTIGVRREIERDEARAECDRLQSPSADGEHLLRIVRDVIPIEDVNGGRLSFRCEDGTRLSFCCGPSGRLNMIVIQHGPDVPAIRNLDAELAACTCGTRRYHSHLAGCPSVDTGDRGGS